MSAAMWWSPPRVPSDLRCWRSILIMDMICTYDNMWLVWWDVYIWCYTMSVCGGICLPGFWTCCNLVLEIRSMDWARVWIQWCLRPNWWMRMVRAKYNYSDQKIDIRIICYAYLRGFGPVFCWSFVFLDVSCRILLSTRHLMMGKHVNMISFAIGWEMLNRDIEMIMLAYLSDKRADSWELLNRVELAKTLWYGLQLIGLICNKRRKSEFSRELQMWVTIMMFSNLPRCRNF